MCIDLKATGVRVQALSPKPHPCVSDAPHSHPAAKSDRLVAIMIVMIILVITIKMTTIRKRRIMKLEV